MKHSGLIMVLALCLFAAQLAIGAGQAAICLALVVAVGSGFVAFARGQWQAFPGLILAMIALLICVSRWGHGMGAVPPWVAIGFVLFALLVLSPMYFLPINVSLPLPSGRYSVGFTDFQIQDPVRDDPFEPGSPRKVWARLWYPADPDATAGIEPRTAYFTGDEVKLWSANIVLGASKAPAFLFSHMRRWRTGACYWQLAPVTGNALPVVVFNHGALAYPTQNTALMLELASHGYAVISIGHPHESCAVRLADGRIVAAHRAWIDGLMAQAKLKELPDYFLAENPAQALGRLDRLLNVALKDNIAVTSHRVWRDDTVAVLDAIAAGQVDGFAKQVFRCCDTGRFASIGMSYGASVAAAVADTDPRCAGAVLLDGMVWDWGLVNQNIRSPLLLFCSDPANMTRHLQALTKRKDARLHFQMNDLFFEKFDEAGQRKDLYRVFVKDADHLGFTDWCLFMRPPLRGLVGMGKVDGRRMIGIVNEFTLAFLEQHFLKRGPNGLEELLQRTPDVNRFDAGYLRGLDAVEVLARSRQGSTEPATA